MKILLTFSSLLLSFAIFSQTNEQILKNNDWYMDYMTINGNNSTPPTNQEIPYLIADFDDHDRLISIYCNWLLGHVDVNTNYYVFESALSHSLQDCDLPSGAMAFEYLYFDFFFTDQTQPFYYEITTGSNGAKTLSITSASGDEAVYGNQQMSVRDISRVSFQLYPNPVKNSFYLQSKSGVKLESVEVYNINGKEVLQFKDVTIYDISGLQKGIYFVKMKSGEGISIEKVVKE